MDIAEQLEQYCKCFAEGEVKQKDIDELISTISNLTCWTSGVEDEFKCDTFLQAERREVIDLPLCMDCAFEFRPHYRPYKKESFTFSLVTINGTEETVTPITDFSFSETKKAFLVDTGLPSCKCGCPNTCYCACDPEYKLLVEYVAGYEELPDCVLPVFCNLLGLIIEKNKCECERDCACGDMGEAEPKFNKNDLIGRALEIDLGKILLEQYKDMIARISICDESCGMWGVIV